MNEESVVSVKCVENGAENGEKQTIKITPSRNSIGNCMKKEEKTLTTGCIVLTNRKHSKGKGWKEEVQLCNMEYNKYCLKIDLKILQVGILTLFHTIVSKQSPTYHLLSSNGMPSSNPYQTITTPYKQQCISICATNPTKCRSFAIKRDAGNFKCFFFDATTSKDDLIPSTGVEYFMDIQSCQDWYRAGARVSGVSCTSYMLPILCIFRGGGQASGY